MSVISIWGLEIPDIFFCYVSDSSFKFFNFQFCFGLAEQSDHGDCLSLLCIASCPGILFLAHLPELFQFFFHMFFLGWSCQGKDSFGCQRLISLFPVHWHFSLVYHSHLWLWALCLSGTWLHCCWAILTPAPATGLLSGTSRSPVRCWQ